MAGVDRRITPAGPRDATASVGCMARATSVRIADIGGSGPIDADGLGRDVSTRSVAAVGTHARDLVLVSVRRMTAVHDDRRQHREVYLGGVPTGSPRTPAARQGDDSVVGLVAPAQSAGPRPICRSNQTVCVCSGTAIMPSRNTTSPNVISMAGARILREVDGDPA